MAKTTKKVTASKSSKDVKVSSTSKRSRKDNDGNGKRRKIEQEVEESEESKDFEETEEDVTDIDESGSEEGEASDNGESGSEEDDGTESEISETDNKRLVPTHNPDADTSDDEESDEENNMSEHVNKLDSSKVSNNDDFTGGEDEEKGSDEKEEEENEEDEDVWWNDTNVYKIPKGADYIVIINSKRIVEFKSVLESMIKTLEKICFYVSRTTTFQGLAVSGIREDQCGGLECRLPCEVIVDPSILEQRVKIMHDRLKKSGKEDEISLFTPDTIKFVTKLSTNLKPMKHLNKLIRSFNCIRISSGDNMDHIRFDIFQKESSDMETINIQKCVLDVERPITNMDNHKIQMIMDATDISKITKSAMDSSTDKKHVHFNIVIMVSKDAYEECEKQKERIGDKDIASMDGLEVFDCEMFMQIGFESADISQCQKSYIMGRIMPDGTIEPKSSKKTATFDMDIDQFHELINVNMNAFLVERFLKGLKNSRIRMSFSEDGDDVIIFNKEFSVEGNNTSWQHQALFTQLGET